MRGSLSNIIKKMVVSLVMISGLSGFIFSQIKISGIINKYSRVTSIGKDYVIVNDATQFAQFSPGDTVLLIQMKGVRIYSGEETFYGTPESSYGPSGMHEFLIIHSMEPVINKITFRNYIVNSTFNIEGVVQLIRVPSYKYAVADKTLTCQPWDSVSKTGGVLSLIAGKTLSLNANIDVTGKGFIGGTAIAGLGICINENSVRFDKYAFHRDSLNSGYKGEGPVTKGWLDLSTFPSIYPGYVKGKGANFTGGGGGNGMFSGGGGGANYGAGGKGGREIINCTGKPADGGLGGKQIKTTPLAGGLFLGAGGGSSTYLAGSTASSGGNGGGIVIIVCDTLKGNNNSILADGAGASAAVGENAGAGGGGGGGAVALYLQSYSSLLSASALTISANGGKGGNNEGTFGEGGGGGGGFINTSNIILPANVTKTIAGGAAGTRKGAVTAGNGGTGENLTSFVPVLNGFLFNSICSSGNGNQVDSFRSNEIPGSITGTLPVGGSGSYTYLWQTRYDFSDKLVDIAGSNTINYIPSTPEINTVWFRRIVRDDVTLLTDTSEWVSFIVLISTGTEKINFPNKMVIFPNPCHDEVEISMNNQKTGNVEIIISGINGRRIFSSNTVKESEEFRYRIPVSQLAPGLYHIHLIIDKNAVCSGRFVVAR